MQSPIVSVIIVSWNTKKMLHDCLMSLRGSDGYEHIKVIVVDNASHDGSHEMVERQFPEVILINSGSNVGFARANNLAIPQINTPLVLYLNPDTVVMHDSIQLMTNFTLSHPSIGAVGCKMKWPDGIIQPLGLQWFPTPLTELVNILFISSETSGILKRYLPYKNPGESGYVSKLYGGCLMVRKHVLDQVGYFDERFFMYGEDVDLCRRIIDGGWQIYYMSNAEIVHLCGGASNRASSHFSTLMKCESIAKFMHKYYGNTGRVLYKGVILLGSLIRICVLTILKIPLAFSRQYDKKFHDSFAKYVSMVKWSLNLIKPIIRN